MFHSFRIVNITLNECFTLFLVGVLILMTAHNVLIESFFATLKGELEILDSLIRDPEQLLCDPWMWIDGYYNRNDVILPSDNALQKATRSAMYNVLN
jgi:hypothetical protein